MDSDNAITSEQLAEAKYLAGRALDECRGAVVFLVRSLSTTLDIGEHNRALSDLENYARTEDCLGDDFSILANLLLPLSSLFLHQPDHPFPVEGPRKAMSLAIEAYKYLDDAENNQTSPLERLQRYVWARKNGEACMDILAGMGLAHTKGMLTLGRSLRRWWSGVIHSK